MGEELPSPEKSPVEIAVARPADAEGIASVQKLTWLDSYPNQDYGITYEDVAAKVEGWDKPESVIRMRASITHPAPDTLRLVARSAEMIVGHCYVIKGGKMNKLQVLYVLPEYQGQGVGSKLAQEGLAWLGDEKDIGLEVVKYGHDAIHFYEKLGFRVAGDARNSITKLPSGIILPTYLMVRPVRSELL